MTTFRKESLLLPMALALFLLGSGAGTIMEATETSSSEAQGQLKTVP